jgi:autotransporter-associated beta strand protein
MHRDVRRRRSAGATASRRRPLAAERLEPRWLLCATHVLDGLFEPDASEGIATTIPGDSSAASVNTDSFAVSLAAATAALPAASDFVATAAVNGLPTLHSLPGAPTAIYLDFDGEGSNAAYDVDGDPATFNATEAATITEAWRQVSVYFSIFDVNVTTVKPTVPFAWHVSSPTISGGYSYVGVFPNSKPESFNTASHARTRVSGIVHEVGHNFGLAHQSDYDLLGNKKNEYSSGFDSLHGPLMGVDYAQGVHKWFIGHPSSSASSLQDDIAVIAGKIKARQPAGGDGFRADDHGGTIATARAIVPAVDGSRSISGIIERMSDADVFSFSTTGAGVSVVSVVPTKPSGLDAKLEIYDGSGELVAASDGGTNDQQIVLPIGAGTWYAIVSSHGDYGDVGSYELTVDDLPTGWRTADVGSVGHPGRAGYDSSTGAFTLAGSGADVFGTADAFRFAYQTLTGNGSIVARVTQNQNTHGWSKVGVEIRESLAAAAKHVALVTTAANGPQLVYRTATGGSSSTVNGTAAAFAALWVRLVRAGNVITASRSADGTSWTTVGSATVSMASTVYVGLLACSHDNTKLNEAMYTDVLLTGSLDVAATDNALPAPAEVSVARGDGTALGVAWQAVPGATGYVVERSDDGVEFSDVGTAGAEATSWVDSDLAGSMRFFYRVRSLDSEGRSVASAVASAVNRPSAVTNASVMSLSTSQVVLDWRDTSGDSGYRIERSSDNVTFSQVGTVGANVPSHTVTGLATGTRYWFRITPLSPFGDSSPTIVSGSTRLAAVGSLSFTGKTATGISLAWAAVANATGYRIERSSDGTTYAAVGSTTGSALSYTDSSVVPLATYHYRVIATNANAEGTNPLLPIFTAVPAAEPLPTPWMSVDIGNVAGTGAAGYAAGVFTVASTGSDIWNTADVFRYTYQPLVGDGSITARVATVENTAGWAKIGVMIRESTAANSKHAMVVVSPSNSVAMQYRGSTGGTSTSIAGPTGKAAPYWVRLERAGNQLTGSVSPDGATWTRVGSVTISMASSVQVGLCANSNTSTRLNTSTFTNVSVEYLVTVPAGQTVVDAGGRTGPLALRKRGLGTLVLAGPSVLTGGLIVEEGTVILRDQAATGGGRIDVGRAGRLTFDVGFESVAAASLAVTDGGVIDVGSGRLVVAAGGITADQVRQMLLAGRSGGGWGGVAGIVSAAAAASGGTRTVGYRVDQAGVTIAYAAAGDVDLDGVVDVADVSVLVAAGEFNRGIAATWSLGDFNYDGLFDLLDTADLVVAGVFNVGPYRG